MMMGGDEKNLGSGVVLKVLPLTADDRALVEVVRSKLLTSLSKVSESHGATSDVISGKESTTASEVEKRGGEALLAVLPMSPHVVDTHGGGGEAIGIFELVLGHGHASAVLDVGVAKGITWHHLDDASTDNELEDDSGDD